VLVPLGGILVAHDDRERTWDLIGEGSVRNLTRHQRLAANSTDAQPGDTVEYELQAINIGNQPLTNVSIDFYAPPDSSATYVAGSCRVRVRPDPPARCSDWMSERDLHVDELAPAERLEVRAHFVVAQPVCDRPGVQQQSESDSDETKVTGPAWTTIRFRPQISSPACGAPLAQLLAAVPTPLRRTCEEWPDAERPELVRLSCNPGDPDYAIYELHDSAAAAQRVFDGYVGEGTPQACGSFGAGVHAYDGGDGVYFACSGYDDEATVDWLDVARHVVGYAGREDKDADALIEWWWASQPQIPTADAALDES